MKRLTRRSLLTAGALAPLVPGQSLARMGGAVAPVAGPPPTPPGSPFITSTTPGSLHNDTNKYRGYRMRVGSQPLTVTALGRWVISGNSQSHTLAVYIKDSLTNLGVLFAGSQVTLSTLGKPPGSYSYVSLSSTVVLWPGTEYWIVSSETNGGDQWSVHNDTSVTTTADASLENAASYDPGTGVLADEDGYGSNKPDVPVNFQYNVGVPGGITTIGTVFSVNTDADWMFAPSISGVVSGAPLVNLRTMYSPLDDGNFIGEWLVWGGGGTIVKRSGALASTQPPPSGHQLLEWTFNTTTLPDGTYVLYPVILDHSAGLASKYIPNPATILIANGTLPVPAPTGPIPIAPTLQSHEVPSAMPDFLTYSGTPFPTRPTYPLPYSFVAPSNSPALRSMSGWYAESPAPRIREYARLGQWATTTSGGILPQWITPLNGQDTIGSYDGVALLNTFSGTRCNSLVSPFTTYAEAPTGGGVWYGAELGGRLFKMLANGDIETIVGWERNKSVLPLMDPPTEDDITRTLVGNFTAPVDDIGGLNDLCFDPRNPDIVYVVSQIDHFIAKVVISTKTVTRYAGSPGTSGYSGDGGAATSALLNNPSSIIMSDGTGNGGPAGTMYVADCYNSAVRKITPTGTISTLYGGTVAPSIPSFADIQVTTTYSVTSMVWSGGSSGSGDVFLVPTTSNIKVGFSIELNGATNAGGSGNPNGVYYVSASASGGQHLTVTKPPAAPSFLFPNPVNGAMTGTMTFKSNNADIYSDPGTVSLTGGTAKWLPFIYSIRFTSNNNIVATELSGSVVRLIDLSANTAVRMGCFGNFLTVVGGNFWFWLACDRVGATGPLDDVQMAAFNDGTHAAHATWRFSIDARWIGFTGYADIFSSDNSSNFLSYAPLSNIAGLGHYPWALSVASTEGRMIGGGTAEFFAANCRITQPSDPAFDFNASLWDAGRIINCSGTASGFPYGVRPAPFSIWGSEAGNGFLLNMTFNDLMVSPYASTTPGDAGDVALDTFIQGGFGGAVPRPELTGNDLRNFKYYIRRSTVAGSVGPTVQQPGPTAADNATPIILSATITRTGTGGTNIHAVWTTDKPTIGMLGGASSTQAALGSYPITSALESVAGPGSYPTTHTLDMLVPPSSMLSPVHVVIVVKDVAGNVAHTLDQAIT